MSWNDKIQNINNLLIYCREWRTKDDIAAEYNMTPVESWHCIKWARSMYSDFETKDKIGITKRSYAIRTRIHVLKEIGYIK